MQFAGLDCVSPIQALTYRIVKLFGYVCVLFQVIYLQRAELSRETVCPMHPSSIHGVEDMSTLAELHEAAIMHNLFLRYHKDNIYVSHCLNLCYHASPLCTQNLWRHCVFFIFPGGTAHADWDFSAKTNVFAHISFVLCIDFKRSMQIENKVVISKTVNNTYIILVTAGIQWSLQRAGFFVKNKRLQD